MSNPTSSWWEGGNGTSLLMDVQAFTLLKGKITHTAINLLSRELDKAKLLAEKFNQQVSFGVAPNETLIVEPDEKCCLCECELPMRFQLSCQCWLYQCVVDLFRFLFLLFILDGFMTVKHLSVPGK